MELKQEIKDWIELKKKNQIMVNILKDEKTQARIRSPKEENTSKRNVMSWKEQEQEKFDDEEKAWSLMDKISKEDRATWFKLSWMKNGQS